MSSRITVNQLIKSDWQTYLCPFVSLNAPYAWPKFENRPFINGAHYNPVCTIVRKIQYWIWKHITKKSVNQCYPLMNDFWFAMLMPLLHYVGGKSTMQSAGWAHAREIQCVQSAVQVCSPWFSSWEVKYKIWHKPVGQSCL